jgi:hypothetical protein
MTPIVLPFIMPTTQVAILEKSPVKNTKSSTFNVEFPLQKVKSGYAVN